MSVVRGNTWILHECDLLVIEVPHYSLEAVENSVSNVENIFKINISKVASGVDQSNRDVDHAIGAQIHEEVEIVKSDVVLVHVYVNLGGQLASALSNDTLDGSIDSGAVNIRENNFGHIKIIGGLANMRHLSFRVIGS